jgi:hypothetical protein
LIEALTPRILSSLLLLVLGLAAMLTLLLSALLLWFYRRAVTREMAASGDFATSEIAPPAPTRRDESDSGATPDGPALLSRARQGPWRLARRYALAGLALALVFAVAARFVYPDTLGLPGFAIAWWIYAWPVVPALLLIVPASRTRKLGWIAIYVAGLALLVLWAGTVKNIPGQVGIVPLPPRSSATPVLTGWLWLVVDGVPMLLVLLCFNRWVRAVGPLVLGLVTTTIGGVAVAYMSLFSPRGIDAAVALATWLELHPGWLVLTTAVLSLAGFGAVGWALARWIARAHRRRAVSDLSLVLDALWILFTVYYALWLILGGVPWAATAFVAFGVYKGTLALTGAAGRRFGGGLAPVSRGLTFLRVFALGQRSARLLDVVAASWRHVGSVQMITGPDVARSTVQPHQFLDFLSRRLASHFVRDARSLARAVGEWDGSADADGRFRINNFFCHADSWRATLGYLVRDDDMVLMDLRSFSAANDGCIDELRHLVANVPLDRCLLLVDGTTDAEFLERTLQDAWKDLPPGSSNRHRAPSETPRHAFAGGAAGARDIVRRLCLGSRPRPA